MKIVGLLILSGAEAGDMISSLSPAGGETIRTRNELRYYKLLHHLVLRTGEDALPTYNDVLPPCKPVRLETAPTGWE